jgi:SAM-dependent methyltransferase
VALAATLTPLRERLRSFAFMSPRDIGLFLRSARTDYTIAKTRASDGDRAAFDAAYDGGDPWASGDSRYLYQRRKYEVLAALLPVGRQFGEVLDLGTGLGLLAERVAGRSAAVLGLDISQSAVADARIRHAGITNLQFEQGDVRDLPATMNGRFDLVMIADTLYYLQRPITDAVLKAMALRIATLLAPGGLCLLANHYFFSSAGTDSRLSRRIHDAFAWSPGFQVTSEHRRPFYLVSLLGKSA